jgi:excinuclease UvrABC helicase subunit UvrB
MKLIVSAAKIRHSYKTYPIYPAYDHASTKKRIQEACVSIGWRLEERLAYFRKEGKLLEAERLGNANPAGHGIAPRIRHVPWHRKLFAPHR